MQAEHEVEGRPRRQDSLPPTYLTAQLEGTSGQSGQWIEC